MPVEMYTLPGPKRPIRIRYVMMSIPILELSAVLCIVQASIFFRPFQIRGHIAHTTRGRPFEASVVCKAKRSPLSCCQQPEDHWSCIAHLSAEDMLN